LESYSFVQTKNSAIVQTIEPAALCGCSIVKVKPSVKVITIEPAQNALSMGEVAKLFSTALAQPLLSLIMFGITARKATVGAITMVLILMAKGQAIRNA
jgi:hypothetical protein